MRNVNFLPTKKSVASTFHTNISEKRAEQIDLTMIICCFQNRRPDYISVFMEKLVSWDAVSSRLEQAKAFSA